MLNSDGYQFSGAVWLWSGAKAAWYFISVPHEVSEAIRFFHPQANRRGWKSIPVEVTIGGTSWRTSIFPDTKSGCYLLPLKASVRKAEGLEERQEVRVMLKTHG